MVSSLRRRREVGWRPTSTVIFGLDESFLDWDESDAGKRRGVGELEGWGKRRPDCARVTLAPTTKKDASKDRETSRAKEGSSAKDENTSDGDFALHIQPGLENKYRAIYPSVLESL